jgi:hypothetical protein
MGPPWRAARAAGRREARRGARHFRASLPVLARWRWRRPVRVPRRAGTPLHLRRVAAGPPPSAEQACEAAPRQRQWGTGQLGWASASSPPRGRLWSGSGRGTGTLWRLHAGAPRGCCALGTVGPLGVLRPAAAAARRLRTASEAKPSSRAACCSLRSAAASADASPARTRRTHARTQLQQRAGARHSGAAKRKAPKPRRCRPGWEKRRCR